MTMLLQLAALIDCVCRSFIYRDGVSLVRRYTGGGTVVVDENTGMIFWLCEEECEGVIICVSLSPSSSRK
jgi:hypothetical protein